MSHVTRRRATAALSLAVALGCGHAAEPPAPLARAERPSAVVLEIALDDVEHALAPLRDALGDRASLVPGSPSALAAGLVEVDGELEDAIEDGPIRIVALEGAGGLDWVVAVPASATLAHLEDEGPVPGLRWVEGEPAAHHRGDDGRGHLVLADDREPVARAAAYLLTAAAERAAPELTAELPSARGAVMLREALDDWLDARERDARLAIAAERRRHEEAPPFGEPEAALALAVDLAHRFTALLPDVAAAHAVLVASPAGPEVSATLSLTPGSPAAERVARLGAAELGPLLAAVPAGTTLAVASAPDAAARAEHTAWLIDAVRALGGERLGPDELPALERVLTAWDAARAEAAVHALAEVEGRPALVFASRGAVAPMASVPLPFASAPYVTTLASALAGCSVAAPAELSLGEGTGAELALCAGATCSVERGTERVVAAIGPPGLAREVAASLGEGDPEPDRARLVARHGGARIAALLFSPERAPLLARALTGTPTPTPSADALLFSVGRSEAGLELRAGGGADAWRALLGWASEP